MRSEIRVTHISTLDKGGAAIAALRLHSGLLRQGVDSSFISVKQESLMSFPKKYDVQRKTKRSLAELIVGKFGLKKTASGRNALLGKNLKGSYETFSWPTTDYRIEEHPLVKQAHIVHLHWVSFFINYSTFFKSIKQPIVWTMHDMNPILGGFHYSGDRERNPAFSGLEEKLKREKARAISAHRNITVVTPSRWLGDCVLGDVSLGSFPCVHIPYSLDTSVFKPHDQTFSRNVFNLPLDKKIVLFVTETTTNYRKGFDLLLGAMSYLGDADGVMIVSIGAGSFELSNDPRTLQLGKVNDEHLLSLLYSAADVFVLPSREDNLPNVMLESLACGTPVIAFEIGGMIDTIQTGVNGILVNSISVEALAAALKNFLDGSFQFDRVAIRKSAVHKFELSVQANRYSDLYSDLLTGQSPT